MTSYLQKLQVQDSQNKNSSCLLYSCNFILNNSLDLPLPLDETITTTTTTVHLTPLLPAQDTTTPLFTQDTTTAHSISLIFPTLGSDPPSITSNSTGTDTSATKQYKDDFPYGHIKLFTEGNSLRCGLYTLRGSLVHQIPSITLLLIDELIRITTTGVVGDTVTAVLQ
jgi:hypothetical protein